MVKVIEMIVNKSSLDEKRERKEIKRSFPKGVGLSALLFLYVSNILHFRHVHNK